jgi:hypothetical protein
MDNTNNLVGKFGTRDELREYLKQQGYPLSKGSLDQLCMPARNEGPEVKGYWGRRPLYDFAVGLAWAKARLQHKPHSIHPPSKRDQEPDPAHA